MDPSVLLQCFAATLQADQGVRSHAESQLRLFVTTPGFLGACLDIVSLDSSQVDPNLRKAAAVYFKNRIVKLWLLSGAGKIDDDEKPIIKDRLLSVLVVSDYITKQQLIPVLRTLVSYDYPKNWPNLLMDTFKLLQNVPNTSKDEDFSHLYTGLVCFAEVCRRFRWVKNEERASELDPVILEAFPHLLNIGNSIVANQQNMTELQAEMLKLILKIYKFVTYYDLPVVLQSRDALTSWGELHCSITTMTPPLYVASSSLSEQEKMFLQISKAYKWSVANINRIFTRYASKSLSKNFNYESFHVMFVNDYIPLLIRAYLSIIEQHCNNQRWVGLSTVYHMLQLLSHAVTQKETWLLIKPFFENLVSHLIYPLLCPTDHVLEIFETDPHEYIHSNFDIYDDMDSPDMAALGLLVTFVDKRKKTTLEPIITFAYNQLTSLQQVHPETVEVAKKKEGALRLVGGISHYVTNPSSPFFPQMEQFLTSLVFPNLNSKFDFLKARTLEVCSKFADLDFKSHDSLSMLFHGILNNFDTAGSSDKEISLPVNLECALAIQAYIQNSQFQEILSTIIVPTMSKLLELSNELDNDSISMVMQECVEIFAEQLQPFGVDLMTKLVDQFMRLAYEVNDASNVDIDDFDGEYEDQTDKVMAAIGFLNTMITVLLSFENSREVCSKLEEVMSPAIEFCLVNKIDDFLSEIGELMENSTFLLRYTTPIMWKNFSYLCETFNDGVALMYVEELTPCLQNFMIFGQEQLAKDPQLQMGFFNILKVILESDSGAVGLNDIIYASELAQSFILALQSYAGDYIPQILTYFIRIFKSTDNDEAHKSNSFEVNFNNVIVCALTANPVITFSVLEKYDELNSFFVRWLALMPKLKRVYDLKLSIVGMISIVSQKDSLGQNFANIFQQFGIGFATLFAELPKSLENFAKRRLSFAASDFKSGPSDEWDDEDELSAEQLTEYLSNEDSLDKETSFNDSTKEYMGFLQEENLKLKNSGFYEEDDEPIVEDPLAATPLDNLDAFQMFRDFGKNLQQNDLASYHTLFGGLNESQQKVLQDIVENKQVTQ